MEDEYWEPDSMEMYWDDAENVDPYEDMDDEDFDMVDDYDDFWLDTDIDG